MSVKIGSGIVSDSLVFHVDVANLNSYNPAINIFTYSEEFDNAAWSKNADSRVFEVIAASQNPNLSQDQKKDIVNQIMGSDPKVRQQFNQKYLNIKKLYDTGSL